MSILQQLDQNSRDLAVSLPYRVGLWMSRVDRSGGEDSQRLEAETLERLVDGFTHNVFGSELVHIVMSETVKRKSDWSSRWQSGLEHVPEECQRAIEALAGAGIEEKEINAYKQRLFEIAEAVALSFREYDELSFFNKIQLYVLFYKARFKAARKGRSFMALDQFLNISLKERRALYKLAGTLGIGYL